MPVGSGIRLVLWLLCHMMTIWLSWFSVMGFAVILILLCSCMSCSGNNPNFGLALLSWLNRLNRVMNLIVDLSGPSLLFDVVPACSCGLVLVY
jgi:hypothetical protein